MDTKHTPGPWIATPDPTPFGANDYCIGDGKTGIDSVATCSKRDAHLISAAPELLSAAYETVSAIEGEYHIAGRDNDYIYDTIGSSMSAAYFSARAAIAKATGAA